MICAPTWRAQSKQHLHRQARPERIQVCRSNGKVHKATSATQDAGLATLQQAEQPGQHAEPAAEHEKVAVRFIINYCAAYGQQLVLLGSSAELGCWDPQQAVRMTWQQGDNWKAEVQLPVPAERLKLHYKYAVVNGDSSFLAWQAGPNITLTLTPKPTGNPAPQQQQGFKVFDSWEQPKHTQHSLTVQVASKACATINTKSLQQGGHNISSTSHASTTSSSNSSSNNQVSAAVSLDVSASNSASSAASARSDSSRSGGSDSSSDSTGAGTSIHATTSSSSSGNSGSTSMVVKPVNSLAIDWVDLVKYAAEVAVGAASIAVAVGTQLASAAAAAATTGPAAVQSRLPAAANNNSNTTSNSSGNAAGVPDTSVGTNPVTPYGCAHAGVAAITKQLLHWQATLTQPRVKAAQDMKDSNGSSSSSSIESSSTCTANGVTAIESSTSEEAEGMSITFNALRTTAPSVERSSSSSSNMLRQAHAVLLKHRRTFTAVTADDAGNALEFSAAIALAKKAVTAFATGSGSTAIENCSSTSSGAAAPGSNASAAASAAAMHASDPSSVADLASAAAQPRDTWTSSSCSATDPVTTTLQAETAIPAQAVVAAAATAQPMEAELTSIAASEAPPEAAVEAPPPLSAAGAAHATAGQLSSSEADMQPPPEAAAAAAQVAAAQLMRCCSDLQTQPAVVNAAAATSAVEFEMQGSQEAAQQVPAGDRVTAQEASLGAVQQQQDNAPVNSWAAVNEPESHLLQQQQMEQPDMLAAAAAGSLDTRLREQQQDTRQQQRHTLLSAALANLQQMQQQQQQQDTADPWQQQQQQQQQQQHTTGPLFEEPHQVQHACSYDLHQQQQQQQQQQVLSGLLDALELSASLRMQYVNNPCDPFLLAADRRLAAAADVFRELTQDGDLVLEQQQQQGQVQGQGQDQVWQEMHASGW